MKIRGAISPEIDSAFFTLTPEKHNLYRQHGRLWFDDLGNVVAVKLLHLSQGVNLHGIPRAAAVEIAKRLRKAGYSVVSDYANAA